MVEWLEANHPGLNVVVNNAGVQYRRDFTGDAAMDALDQEVAINLTAPIHLIAELLPMLRTQEQGLITPAWAATCAAAAWPAAGWCPQKTSRQRRVAQLAADKDEILVGMSVETRRQGEALFERMNNRS